jgi:hypothetical protein
MKRILTVCLAFGLVLFLGLTDCFAKKPKQEDLKVCSRENGGIARNDCIKKLFEDYAEKIDTSQMTEEEYKGTQHEKDLDYKNTIFVIQNSILKYDRNTGGLFVGFVDFYPTDVPQVTVPYTLGEKFELVKKENDNVFHYKRTCNDNMTLEQKFKQAWFNNFLYYLVRNNITLRAKTAGGWILNDILKPDPSWTYWGSFNSGIKRKEITINSIKPDEIKKSPAFIDLKKSLTSFENFG